MSLKGKNMDKFEVDTDVLKDIAGGKFIYPDLLSIIRNAIKNHYDDPETRGYDADPNPALMDLYDFAGRHEFITEEELKKHFKEKYGITW